MNFIKYKQITGPEVYNPGDLILVDQKAHMVTGFEWGTAINLMTGKHISLTPGKAYTKLAEVLIQR